MKSVQSKPPEDEPVTALSLFKQSRYQPTNEQSHLEMPDLFSMYKKNGPEQGSVNESEVYGKKFQTKCFSSVEYNSKPNTGAALFQNNIDACTKYSTFNGTNENISSDLSSSVNFTNPASSNEEEIQLNKLPKNLICAKASRTDCQSLDPTFTNNSHDKSKDNLQTGKRTSVEILALLGKKKARVNNFNNDYSLEIGDPNLENNIVPDFQNTISSPQKIGSDGFALIKNTATDIESIHGQNVNVLKQKKSDYVYDKNLFNLNQEVSEEDMIKKMLNQAKSFCNDQSKTGSLYKTVERQKHSKEAVYDTNSGSKMIECDSSSKDISLDISFTGELLESKVGFKEGNTVETGTDVSLLTCTPESDPETEGCFDISFSPLSSVCGSDNDESIVKNDSAVHSSELVECSNVNDFKKDNRPPDENLSLACTDSSVVNIENVIYSTPTHESLNSTIDPNGETMDSPQSNIKMKPTRKLDQDKDILLMRNIEETNTDSNSRSVCCNSDEMDNLKDSHMPLINSQESQSSVVPPSVVSSVESPYQKLNKDIVSKLQVTSDGSQDSQLISVIANKHQKDSEIVKSSSSVYVTSESFKENLSSKEENVNGHKSSSNIQCQHISDASIPAPCDTQQHEQEVICDSNNKKEAPILQDAAKQVNNEFQLGLSDLEFSPEWCSQQQSTGTSTRSVSCGTKEERKYRKEDVLQPHVSRRDYDIGTENAECELLVSESVKSNPNGQKVLQADVSKYFPGPLKSQISSIQKNSSSTFASTHVLNELDNDNSIKASVIREKEKCPLVSQSQRHREQESRIYRKDDIVSSLWESCGCESSASVPSHSKMGSESLMSSEGQLIMNNLFYKDFSFKTFSLWISVVLSCLQKKSVNIKSKLSTIYYLFLKMNLLKINFLPFFQPVSQQKEVI